MKKILNIIVMLSVLGIWSISHAESLSNIVSTGSNYGIDKNLENAKGIYSDGKKAYSDFKVWYRTNNTYIQVLPYINVRQMDFFSGLLIIITLMWIVLKYLTKRW